VYNYNRAVEQLSFWGEWGTIIIICLVIVAFIIFLIALGMVVFPIYGVWSSKKSGEASLAEANFAEQVAIAKATARLRSAQMNKEAEVIEAEAVANSITTIGERLKANEGYLRWQWIKMMGNTRNSTIYVPTEAGLPILEAGKR